MPAKIIHRRGDKLHEKSKLTYIKDVKPTIKYKRRALFDCACGNQCYQRVDKVVAGLSTNCGCARVTAEYVRSTEYSVFRGMKRRCYDKHCKDYKNYGARGIDICAKWLQDPSKFIEDMGERPTSKHQIDRIDNDSGYSPDNCRWVLNQVNSSNSRTSKWWFVDGKRFDTLRELAGNTGISMSSAYKLCMSNINGFSCEKKYPS